MCFQLKKNLFRGKIIKPLLLTCLLTISFNFYPLCQKATAQLPKAQLQSKSLTLANPLSVEREYQITQSGISQDIKEKFQYESEKQPDTFYIGLYASILGFGPEFGYHIPNTDFRIRAITGFFSIDDSVKISGIQYQGSLNLNNIIIAAEYAPSQAHISLGLAITDNALTLNFTPEPGHYINIGNGRYESGVSAKIAPGLIAPYIGFGFKPKLFSFLSMGFDIGVLFFSAAQVRKFTATDSGVLQADIDEEIRQINKYSNKISLFPFFGLSLLAQF